VSLDHPALADRAEPVARASPIEAVVTPGGGRSLLGIGCATPAIVRRPLDRFALPREEYARADVARVAVPTLVMWGEEDALIPFSAAHWYSDALPNAELVHYPGIGHLPMEEAPERSAADLRAWLAERSLVGATQLAVDRTVPPLAGTR
jgi:pimeloyl-ACP methyl ester carboxylesterase